MDELMLFNTIKEIQKKDKNSYLCGFRNGIESAARELNYYFSGKLTEGELARRLLEIQNGQPN